MGKSLSKEEEQQVKKRRKELEGPKHRRSLIDSRKLFLHLKPTTRLALTIQQPSSL
jgi:hypothetical protein